MEDGAHYIYHVVPPKTTGTILYPLNQLREKDPISYEEQILKYKGREKLLERHIPILDCLWNDVLFLTAVHPKKMMAALRGAGYNREHILRSFQFDINQLDTGKIVVMLHRHGEKPTYEKFDSTRWTEYDVVPQDTLDHFRRQREKGEAFMFFGHVPHILYQGSLDTTDIAVVEG